MKTAFFSDDVRRNPYPLYEMMRATTPVLHEPNNDLYLVFEHDAARRALQDAETFSSAAAGGGAPAEWLIFLDPPKHTKLRALISRAFTSRGIASLEPRIDQLAKQLLDAAAARDPHTIDLVTDFSAPLPMMVIAEMLGLDPADWPRFSRWTDAMLDLSTVVSNSPEAERAIQRFIAVTAEMRDHLGVHLDARRTSPRDDLLTRLLHAEVDGERLSDAELLGFFQMLLVAGSETTTNLLSNTVLCLLDHPDAAQRLRAQHSLLPSAIEEVLRYRSPVQTSFRVSRKTAQLAGVTIPAGKLVLVVLGSANRDPKQFPEPDRFDISRDPNPHLAFGHGFHFCLGAPLSRLEARVALPRLLAHLGDCAPQTDRPWQPRNSFHVHGPTSLPLRRGAAS